MSFAVYYGQIVVGPAGSGKSTYCKIVQEMATLLKRKVWVVNLDPAAENFMYQCDLDIRELISVQDVMEELKLGPNGGLVYCMEYLLEEFSWLEEQLLEFGQDDYILFDCPGQIELYTHYDLMAKLVKKLQNIGFNLVSMYMVDVTLLQDERKFTSGLLMALACTMNLELPHITVLTKCDLVPDKDLLNKYIEFAEDPGDPDQEFGIDQEINVYGTERITNLQSQSITKLDKKFASLNKSLKQMISQHSSVSLYQLDMTNVDTIHEIMYQADICIQYGESLEPNDKQYENADNYLFEQVDF